MRRLVRILGIVLAVLIGLPVLLVLGVLIGANTDAGRRLIERETASLTGGEVRIDGLAGRFPDRLRLAHAALADKNGVYATIDGLVLDWSPLRLLAGEALVDRLAADRVAVARQPVASGASSSSSTSLPLAITVRSLAVPRVELAEPVAGVPVALSLAGSLALASLQQGSADLHLTSLEGDARYDVSGRVDPARILVRASIREPSQGLVTGLAGLPGLTPLALDASLDGPRSAIATRIALSAGQLRAAANGTVDLANGAADLAVTADAPAMQPAPDIAWRSVHIAANVQGPFTKPHATGTVRIEALAAAGASARLLAADLRGDQGEVTVHARLEGARIPGPKPDLLDAAPLVIDATARLDAPDRPIRFSLSHPLVTAAGTARTAPAIAADMTVHLPDLAPLAAAGGTDLAGHADLKLVVTQRGEAVSASAEAALAITGGMAPVPALLGPDAKLAAAGTFNGSTITLARLTLDGRAIALSAQGGYAGGERVGLDWTLRLADLAALAPTVVGTLDAKGAVHGTVTDLAADATLGGDVAVRGMPRGPIRAQVALAHLPAAPSGRITAQGELAGAPLALDASVAQQPDGAMRVDIVKADWKSAHAQGTLTLPRGASFPLGSLDLRMARLDDLRPFLGQPLSGGVTAALTTETREGKQAAHLRLQARDAGMPGTATIARAGLDATVTDPAGAPSLAAELTADGIAAGGVTGSARLSASGPRNALAARLSANLQNLAGAPATVSAVTTLDVPASEATVSSLAADWKGENLRLLAPVRIGFGSAVTVDRLRLGIGQATAEIAGRLSPTLDLTAALRNVTPDLVKPFAPGIDAQGTLRADATITGTAARPSGTVRLEASGLRMRSGPGRALPPANLSARADLAGASARLDARLAAGRLTTVTVTGTAPTDPAGALDLRAAGRLDLALLDPILSAAGRRVRGQVTLDATVQGTAASPRLGGTARLSGGEIQDFGQGVHITDIAADVSLEGETVRIARFAGRAGRGTIDITGSVGVLTPDQAIDLTITARHARPVASALMTADLDADLTVHGQLAAALTLGGRVRILRADINIPEKMPPSVAVLHVRRPGEKPAPPPPPGPEIALDLTIDAERAIFLRGRGVYAELAGTVRVRGTTTNPQPLGSFTMRQGTISVAGQTLTFTRGEVSFNGGSLTDPSLNFVASSSNGSVTASLAITGTVSAPRITLSSTPELPQDEVLAQLLFKRGTSSLSPFELAEIAAALASLTGVGPDIGNPLESLRKDLGLDQLSVGTGAGGGPSLQAGRYVAPGVFVGARQGASGTSTQGLVQVDIARGLKLEGTVGTGQNTNPGASPAESGGSSVGVTYQFEY